MEHFEYNPKSLKADEFICNDEILESLKYADENKNNREVIEQILQKARLEKGLTHREASVLLACDIPEINEQIATVPTIAKGARQSIMCASARNAKEIKIKRADVSPMHPARFPMKYCQRVLSSIIKVPDLIAERVVAEEIASTAETVLGLSQLAPIAAGKLRNMNARPVRAGLKTLEPIPPKSPFATIIATAAPITNIQIGTVGEETKASIMPLTQAERFETTTFCLVIFWKMNSKKTQDATDTRILIKAPHPKSTIPIIASGSIATITVPIIIWGLHFKLKWGLDETCMRLILHLPLHQILPRPWLFPQPSFDARVLFRA